MLSFDLRLVDRRRLLRQLSFAIGGGATFALTAGERLNTAFACASQLKVTAIQKTEQNCLFTPLQFNALQAICALLLPIPDHKTHAYFCREFVQHQLVNCHHDTEQKRMVSLLDSLNDSLNNSTDPSDLPPFHLVNAKTQNMRLMQSYNANSKHEKSFELLKSLIIFGYLVFEFYEKREHKLQFKEGRFVELTFIDTKPLRRQLAG
ncbi:gluconate 2-dehydrogenase subunit 3 family protein [Algibacillus agarilyticus]|uniref:gluconate 2-dehydrogenase subunit 3 family protein n=1 Tax=Algibacillus agarilyticus TaxID=2234133 RepID=UPI000DD04058|nr:gluconate 2-dehydrogenase subunit 3 family protein [Algibacillus agarilyticus]